MEEINAEYLTIKTGVVLPGLQALVNGCFYGGATSGVVVVANHMHLLDVSAWAVGVTVGSLSVLWAWRGLLEDWRMLLYGLEAEPDQEPVTVIQPEPIRVELSENDGRSMQFVDLPADPHPTDDFGRWHHRRPEFYGSPMDLAQARGDLGLPVFHFH